MSKADLSERDICTKCITPAIQAAGWDLHTQVREEVTFTKGRIIVRGQLTSRGQTKRADYILYHKPNLPLAVVEAKDNSHSVGAGMQQALAYAEALDIPFVFSSNGDGFLEHDRTATSGTVERELTLAEFPSPATLWQRYCAWKGLEAPAQQTLVSQDYYSDGSGRAPRYYQLTAINRVVQGKRDANGEVIDDRVYNQQDFDRSLVLGQRTRLVAEKVAAFLTATDPFARTIVFCEDIDHAERMRQALVNALPELAAQNRRYVVRITGDNDEGKAELDHFIDPESPYPVIATTSKLLSTGVDVQTCKLIVLDQRIQSMTEFKQIIGRGTRINEDYGKTYFTILDFKKATELFADPAFDGDPVQIYEPGDDDPPVPPEDLPEDDPLCVTNLTLHDVAVDLGRVRHDNTLARPLISYTPKERVDVILTNPPFGGMEEDGIEQNFPQTFRTRKTADLFLVLIIHLLKDGGRGAIVLPDGTLFGEGIKTRVKEKLLTECNLHTIVRLPNGVFAPYTGIKTNLLFFTKGQPTREVWYYEHPYPPGAKSYSKTKPIRIEEFGPEKAWWHSRVENEYAWRVPVEAIKANGYNLDIKNPHQIDAEQLDPEHLLASYKSLLADVAEAREALRRELAASLER